MHKLKSHKTVEQIAKKHRLDVSFIQKQLNMGEPIEHEHTKDHDLAKDIALQHLDEIPDYYTRLKKLEASAKKEHKKFKDMKEEARSLKTTNPCWKGYEPVGTKKKKGKTVPNCVPIAENEMIRYCPKCKKNESRNGCKYGPKYWDLYSIPIKLGNIDFSNPHYHANSPHPGNFPESYDHEHSMARSEISTIISAAKRLRKKMKGEGNIEAWVQSKITKAADYLDSAADYVDSGEMKTEGISIEDVNGNTFAEVIDIIGPNQMKPIVDEGCWKGYKQISMEKKEDKMVPNYCSSKEQKTFSQFMGEAKTPAWQRKEGQRETGGLSQKGVASYRREHPGSKLQTAVTTKPSKLKKGSKSWKRRKSFCSRMRGMKEKLTSEKTARDPNSRINKSLRAWNC